MLKYVAAAACAVALVACGGGPKTTTVAVAPQPDYKLTTTATGTGNIAEAGDTIVFNYVGYLYDATKADGKGAKVESSVDRNQPFSGTVGVGALKDNGVVMTGWDQALLGMQAGGKRTAVLPANLAYGVYALDAQAAVNGNTYAAIPANSPLVFDFEMLSVTKKVTIPSVPPPTVTTITDVTVGTGTVVTAGSKVNVRYTGWLYDGTRANFKGTQFDSNATSTTYLQVTVGTGVIAGFSTGLTGMQVGGKRTVIIPPDQGYGATAQTTSNGTIPANSTLVFDIEVISFQ
ncbi:FKBP-type peptidyl-prolyl cis-trans isomerase [Duganella callida]|nr:FKBP-type peptidyl-prolyl cis-trans isomerase [Duganella callida]